MKFQEKYLIGIVLLALLIDSSASHSDNEMSESMRGQRLPNNTIPREYRVRIEPKIGDFPLTWTGSVEVDIEVASSTESLTLHADRGLSINEKLTELVGPEGISVAIRHDRDNTTDFLTLGFRKKIWVGNYTLRLHFNGFRAIENDEFGLYKFSEGYESSPMAVGTLAEPMGMRRIFPCYDEPDLKARFGISIVHSPNYTAISNMPEIASEKIISGDFYGQILTTFETTPVMSTYLVNLVIAEYKSIQNVHGNVTLFGSPKWFEETRYMLDFSEKVVKVMEKYTGLSFGFPRIGAVLMPGYSSSATEYWGLVTYNHEEMLIDGTRDNTKKIVVAYTTIAHEMAHSWFGNLVTMRWWDNVWLNEGFATYFSYYIMGEIYSNFGALELFILENNQEKAFAHDGGSKTVLIKRSIILEDASAALPQIAYRKGAAIVHMIRNILGDGVFRSGIQKYLAKHSFQSVVTNDLMAALQEAYDVSREDGKHLNLSAVMTPWLMLSGYPVISVRRNVVTGDVEVSQQNAQVSDDSLSNKWWVPLTYATKSNPDFSSTLPVSWISDKDDSVKLNGIDQNDWIVLNIRASGYYRVDYDDGNWNRLFKYLNSDNYENIHVLNRVQLISDVTYFLNLHQTERYYNIFYKLTNYLSRETEYLPWRAALRGMREIEGGLDVTELRSTFRSHFLKLVDKFVETVGFEVRDTDDHFSKLSRLDVIDWACKSGHSGCSKYAARKLIKLMDNPEENRLHPDTVSWMFCAGLRGLDDRSREQFAHWAYENSATRYSLEEKAGCTENHAFHRNILMNALLNKYQSRAFGNVVQGLLVSSDENFNFTVDYFVEHYEDIIRIREEGSGPIFLIVASGARSRIRQEKFSELLRVDAVRTLLNAVGFNGMETDTLSIFGTEERSEYRFTASQFSVMPGRKRSGYHGFFREWDYTERIHRLPNNTIPRQYSIVIEPKIGNFDLTWTGNVVISIEIVKSTRSLILHAYKNLVINETLTKIVGPKEKKLPIEHDRDEANEFLILRFRKNIRVGNYTLHLYFTGSQTTRNDPFGLFKFTGGNENIPMVLGTDSELIGARRIFPCWDEPGLKSRFIIRIVHFRNYTVSSNMPEIASAETTSGKILTTFDTTPMMSTYLVNFVIADSKAINNAYRNVSLHGSRGGVKTSEHVLDLISKAVRVMESYTGFPIDVPTIGSVLIPRYRPAAMEQWALISHKVSFNETVNTTRQRDKADMTIAQEIAHSWFGNRVTPLWWDDLWISEGFATYFQYYIIDEVYKNWGGSELFVLKNNQETTFALDGESQYAVRWTPTKRTGLPGLFVAISQHKGAAIIHMFRNVLGENAFRAGIRKFISKHSFKAAEATDLMTAFQEAYDVSPDDGNSLNVSEAMTPWLVQSGYPIVSVKRNTFTGDVEVSQQNMRDPENNYFNKWWVPLTYATRSNPNFTSTSPIGWMSDTDDSVILKGIAKDDWIVMNIRASGYYRVDYDDDNWKKLFEYLNSDNYNNIHVLNRAQLISDALYLVENHKTNWHFNVLWKLMKYLSREVEYPPWRAALRAMESIERAIITTELHVKFQKYFLKLMEKFVQKVGFEVRHTDDHFTKLSRTDVIDWACRSGHSGCSEFAAKKLVKLTEGSVEKYLSNGHLHPDTISWTFCAGLRGLDDEAAKKFADWAHENARDLLESNAGCTENHRIHRKVLEYSLKYVDVDFQKFTDVFVTVLKSSDENFNFTIDFFLEKQESIQSSAETGREVEFVVMLIAQEIKHTNGMNKARLEKFKELLRFVAVRRKLSDPEGIAEEVDRQIFDEDPTAHFIHASKHLPDNEMFTEQLEYFYETYNDNEPKQYEPVVVSSG